MKNIQKYIDIYLHKIIGRKAFVATLYKWPRVSKSYTKNQLLVSECCI